MPVVTVRVTTLKGVDAGRYYTERVPSYHLDGDDWERQASLRLRAGDPGVLIEYERQGRVRGGTLEEMEADIITVWQQARSRVETVALMANSIDTVTRLNRLAQQTRIMAGELDVAAPRLRVGEEWWVMRWSPAATTGVSTPTKG